MRVDDQLPVRIDLRPAQLVPPQHGEECPGAILHQKPDPFVRPPIRQSVPLWPVPPEHFISIQEDNRSQLRLFFQAIADIGAEEAGELVQQFIGQHRVDPAQLPVAAPAPPFRYPAREARAPFVENVESRRNRRRRLDKSTEDAFAQFQKIVQCFLFAFEKLGVARTDIDARVALQRVQREPGVERGEGHAGRTTELQADLQKDLFLPAHRLQIDGGSKIAPRRRPVRSGLREARENALKLPVQSRLSLPADAVPVEYSVFIRLLRFGNRLAEQVARIFPISEFTICDKGLFMMCRLHGYARRPPHGSVALCSATAARSCKAKLIKQSLAGLSVFLDCADAH